MIKKLLLTALVVISFARCYRVNEYEYLNIGFQDNHINSYFLERYIDSVRNKNLIIPNSIKDIFLFGNKLDDNERIIFFKNYPQEWYFISFYSAPCSIKYIYNRRLAMESINKRSFLGEEQLIRIERRFRNEILLPAEKYGKMRHLPDSIIYNTKFR